GKGLCHRRQWIMRILPQSHKELNESPVLFCFVQIIFRSTSALASALSLRIQGI
ncbi:hypothetical protein KY284_023465, partial [Solanum tuberosum]